MLRLLKKLVIYYKQRRFKDSQSYWHSRYTRGRGPGKGSTGKFMYWKNQYYNELLTCNPKIRRVFDLGCGDGRLWTYHKTVRYVGYDISTAAVMRARKKAQPNQSYIAMRSLGNLSMQPAQLTISLEVIFHLVEDKVYENYMEHLFDRSTKYVWIVSSNRDWQDEIQPPHVKHRRFTSWIKKNRPEWKLHERVGLQNRFGSFGDSWLFRLEKD